MQNTDVAEGYTGTSGAANTASKRLTPGRYRILLHATGTDGAQTKDAVVYLWVLAPADGRGRPRAAVQGVAAIKYLVGANQAQSAGRRGACA